MQIKPYPTNLIIMNSSGQISKKNHMLSLFLIMILLIQCTENISNNPEKPAVSAKDGTAIKKVNMEEEQDTGWVYLEKGEDGLPKSLTPSFNKNTQTQAFKWENISQGLAIATVDAPIKCSIGDSKIRIIKVSPKNFNFKLLTFNELKSSKSRTAKEYCSDFELVGAINSSMFGFNRASIGYMKNFDQVNNGRLNKDKCIIAFNPKQKNIPAFKIIDLGCEQWEDWKDKYNTYIQNIRMIDCNRKVRWGKQEKFWSTACIGEDSQGNALFIHSRSPYRVHDLAKMLLQLPIDLQNCCYLEGGPESTLYLKHNDTELSSFGSYETDFNEDDLNKVMWQIPNVIGFTKQ